MINAYAVIIYDGQSALKRMANDDKRLGMRLKLNAKKVTLWANVRNIACNQAIFTRMWCTSLTRTSIFSDTDPNKKRCRVISWELKLKYCWRSVSRNFVEEKYLSRLSHAYRYPTNLTCDWKWGKFGVQQKRKEQAFNSWKLFCLLNVDDIR